jgi:hypothetical protein
VLDQENVMNRPWTRGVLLVSILAGLSLAVACRPPRLDGVYRDAADTFTVVLSKGKASMVFGGVEADGTYTVSGNKITITLPTRDASQPLVFVFTMDSDGSLEGSGFKLLKRM